MNFLLLFIPNMTAVIIMIGLFSSSYKAKDYDSRDVRIIYGFAVLIILESVFEIVSQMVDGVATLVWLNYLSNSLSYMINAMLGFAWIVFVKTKLERTSFFADVKQSVIYAIPAIIIIALSILNFFVPVFYRIEDSLYHRTILYLIPTLVAASYMIYGAVEFSLKTGKNQKYKFYPVFSFLLPIVFFVGVQFLGENVNLATLGLSIGVIILYLDYKNEQACVDSLSGLFNRQFFDRHLKSAINHKSRKMLCGIMLDIDAFKSINDTYGHLVGNDAIQEAAKILFKVERHTKTEVFCFRYGGDEFVLLQSVEKEDEINDLIDRIKDYSAELNALGDKPYDIEFSLGYAIFDENSDTIETFVSRMDEAMYRNKQDKKAKAYVK